MTLEGALDMSLESALNHLFRSSFCGGKRLMVCFAATIFSQLPVLPVRPDTTLEGALDHLWRPRPLHLLVEERD